jgi:hypothetical protein
LLEQPVGLTLIFRNVCAKRKRRELHMN